MFSTSLSRRAVAVALVCVLALAAFGAAGSVAAQDGGSSTDTSTNESQDYQIQIDPAMRLVSSEWDGSTVTMVVESDITRQVTITDASVQEVSGARDLRRKTVTVPSEGQTEITFTVENPDVRKVTASTPYGIVLVGETDGGSTTWFDGPATWGLIFLSVPVTGYGTFWGTKRYLEKQEREQEERQMEVVG